MFYLSLDGLLMCSKIVETHKWEDSLKILENFSGVRYAHILCFLFDLALPKQPWAIKGDQLLHELTRYSFHKVLPYCRVYSQYEGAWWKSSHYLEALFGKACYSSVLSSFYVSLPEGTEVVMFRPRVVFLDISKSEDWSFYLVMPCVATKCAATRARVLWYVSSWGHRNELCMTSWICSAFSPR